MSELHVIFGSGPAGTATARALTAMGERVRVVNRSGKANAALPDGIEVAAADVRDPIASRNAAEGATVIYSCLNAPYHRWPQEFPALQSGVLKAAEQLHARLVALENLYMYGEVVGPMSEGLPNTPCSRKGQVRAAMNTALMVAHEQGRVRVAIGRASDFYGPGVTASSLGERFFRPLVQGKGGETMGDPQALHSYAYIDDVGRGLATLGMNSQADGQVWHLPHAPAISHQRIAELAAAGQNFPAKVRTTPRWMLSIAGLFISDAGEMVEMLYEFEKPFVVAWDKYAAAFGEGYTSMEDGLRATVDWYLQHAN